MHTKQLFPAVCFCKDLIPDAVKCWCSLTSVKALILLLWLNTFSKKIFFAFLGFHKWSLTFLRHCHVFVLHTFSLHTTCLFLLSSPGLSASFVLKHVETGVNDNSKPCALHSLMKYETFRFPWLFELFHYRLPVYSTLCTVAHCSLVSIAWPNILTCLPACKCRVFFTYCTTWPKIVVR